MTAVQILVGLMATVQIQDQTPMRANVPMVHTVISVSKVRT